MESGLCMRPGQRNFLDWVNINKRLRKDTDSLGQSAGAGQRPFPLTLS